MLDGELVSEKVFYAMPGITTGFRQLLNCSYILQLFGPKDPAKIRNKASKLIKYRYMKMNKYVLLVMEELKNDTLFYKTNNLLLYTIPKDGEVLDNKAFGGKVTAVWDLYSLGAIKIHNKGEERIPGTMIHEFQILIIQPAFDGIYKKCIKEVMGQSLENYENQIQTKKNMTALLKKLNLFISVNEFGKKQAKFLQQLSNFEPILLKELEKDIPTKDIKDLKKRVQKKIRGSGFYIKTVRGNSFNRGAYQLTNIPPAKT